MDDTAMLFLLSLAMLVGCYVAGSIPLAISLSEEKMKIITVLGAGLLVGTALAVIIPEGVHTLYAGGHGHSHHAHSPSLAQDAAKVLVEQESHGIASHDEATIELHTYIGISLVCGFVFMLLVDQLSGGTHSHMSADPEASNTVSHNRNNMTTTLGLVVHAAADGIALGAAASTSQTHVEVIVFVAIMLHKAPAAFGLVSILLHEGFDRTRIRKHLAVFSFAAPLAAMITYFGLSQAGKETLSEVNATAIAMLFSAGTFLYVATVHVLPELASMGRTNQSNVDGTIIVRETKGFTKFELAVMVFGSILPVFLSMGHKH